MKVYGFEYTGYRSRIADMSSYFEANMQLLYLENLNRLFPRSGRSTPRCGTRRRCGMRWAAR